MMGHSNLEGKNFLDLYAGTGSVGIRALELEQTIVFSLTEIKILYKKLK